MITPYHKEFLSGTHAYWLSTASAGNIPDAARCSMPIIENETTLRCFVVEKFAARLQKNITENKHISFQATHMFTFEAYQYKGTVKSIHLCTEKENKFQEHYWKSFSGLTTSIGLSEEKTYNMYNLQPSFAIIIKVEEIYEQALKPHTANEG